MRLRSSPARAKLSQAGCITRYWPAGCGRWLTAPAAFPVWFATWRKELGKQARFEVVGEATGVDRDILDRLEAPLNHLIRNALDHGIEPPEDRLSRR